MISLINFQEKPSLNPNIRSNHAETRLKTNLLRSRLNSNIQILYVYSIAFPSNVPADNTFIKRLILRNSDRSLREQFERFIIAGDNLLSSVRHDIEKVFISKVITEGEDRVYEIRVNLIPDQTFDLLKKITREDTFYRQKKYFLEILIKNILSANRLMRIRKIYFDKDRYETLNFNSFSIYLLS